MKAEVKLVKPEDDERLHFILTKLTEGMDREELAEEMDHKNYKSLDMFMRRRNYRWDSKMKNYVPRVEDGAVETVTSKASRIIQLISENPEDLSSVCHKLKFKDLEELKQYMTVKGYNWNNTLNNYEISNSLPIQIPTAFPEVPFMHNEQQSSHPDTQAIADYLPLLKMLLHNEERLKEMLIPFGEGATLPRYAIEGIKQPKTVQLVYTLGNLITDYGNEKGLYQNEIVEIALIDFFRKYGYEKEIAALLNTT